MHLKKAISALLALLMGLLSGCGKKEADKSVSSSDKTTSTVSSEKITNGVVITALNVGKADCFVIQSKKSVTMIDTGTEESAKTIEKFLDDSGITRIDLLFISHYDKDHVGGADHIIRHYEVGQVYATYYVAKESDDIDEYNEALKMKGLSPVLVSKEMSVSADGVTWTLYPPQKENYKKDTSNNSSMAARMRYGKVAALFTGDAQKARISELVKTEGLQSSIIKMPHHGEYEKNIDELLEWVQPQYAILTGSKSQPEDDKTMEVLEQYGVEAYCTRNGTITMRTDGKSVTVTQG